MKNKYVNVNNNYRFSVDGKNYRLETSYEKQNSRGRNCDKNGNIGWKTIGYYNKLEKMLEAIIEMDVKSHITESLEDVKNHMDKLKEELFKVIQNKNNLEQGD